MHCTYLYDFSALCRLLYHCINRLITRVVLVPFVTPAYSRTPMEQDRLDTKLARRMEDAGRGAGVIVRVGSALLSSPADLDSTMGRVAQAIPSAKPRVHSSYALLLLCTLKVSHNTHMCTCLLCMVYMFTCICNCTVCSCWRKLAYGNAMRVSFGTFTRLWLPELPLPFRSMSWRKRWQLVISAAVLVSSQGQAA